MITAPAGAAGPDAEIAARLQWLDRCLLSDRARFRRRLKQLRRRLRRTAAQPAGERSWEERLGRITAEMEQSAAVASARASASLQLAVSPALPVAAHAEALKQHLCEHQVVIVSGATGSGKSTQLPKLCLALGRGVHGRIGHTQPRRIAARAIARRVASEISNGNTDVVAHCVRFDDTVAPSTRLKVMTDGILLNEIQHDPWLHEYDTLIIDEVHERSVNIDVILGYLQRVLRRRRDLRVVITSATLDATVFEALFEDSVVYDIPGRGFPVDIRYRPPPDDSDDGADLNAALIEAVRELDAEERGDILVFLPGEREIREAHKSLAGAFSDDTEVLDLYARLNAARQARIFSPGPARRIILATNVAETSLTVPRIRHVIDTGYARVSRYSPRRKLQQLPTEKIARANADQRAGRCGREAPGICLRLYSENDYLGRRATMAPEILRTNLAGVILRLRAMGVDDIDAFAFANAPADRLLKDGFNVLQEIGALDGERVLTTTGASLNRFPVDPRLGRVLLAAAGLGCLREALIIAAAMSIADPRERPHERREQADRAHAAFADKRSDFLWFVKAWPRAQELAALPPGRRLRQCRRLFLSAARVQEWVQLHAFLRARVDAEKWQVNEEPAGYKAIHSALIAGFPSFIGEWQNDHYSGCRNLAFVLHPSSVLHKREVKWLLAGEIVETARPYARLAARIDPHWIDHVAGHLIRRTYEVPHFDARRGLARVTEIQRLFGLVLSASRLVNLEPLDPEGARRLFIDEGLLAGELGDTPEFLQHNHALLQRIGELEARTRRRDLAAPPARLHAFYAARIPASICSRRALLRWLRETPEHAAALFMDEADATQSALSDVPAYLFPDTLPVAGTDCALTYRFAPGAADDGVTIELPLALLPVVQETDLDRLVPGLLSAKVEGLLRGLPKPWRRQFSPVREFAMAAVEALHDRRGPLPEVLAGVLATMCGRDVAPALFDQSALEPHLNMLVAVIDRSGAVQARDRDLARLRARCGEAARTARAALSWNVAGRSAGAWVFGELPVQVSQPFDTAMIHAYPALAVDGDEVAAVVLDDALTACASHVRGLARLLFVNLRREVRRRTQKTRDVGRRALLAGLFGLRTDVGEAWAAAWCLCYAQSAPDTRNADAFNELLATARAALERELPAALCTIAALHERGAAIRQRLLDAGATVPGAVREDILSQLGLVLGPPLLTLLARGPCDRHERYLDALARRLERVDSNPGKDQQKLAQIAPLWAAFSAVAAGREESVEVAELLIWFEEWRIALFAPEFRAAGKPDPVAIAARLTTLTEDHT